MLQPLRFEHNFLFKLPSFDERKEIFQKKLQKFSSHFENDGESDIIASESEEGFIADIVKSMHGFSGADIDRLISQAILNFANSRETSTILEVKKHKISREKGREIFSSALNEVKPSTLVEFEGLSTVPPVYFSQFAGIDDVIEKLRVRLTFFLTRLIFSKMSVILPLKKPQALKELGVHPPSGVIFYGPPGTPVDFSLIFFTSRVGADWSVNRLCDFFY